MNVNLLASEIVSKIRNSMRDSTLNQEIMVARMIREAFESERAATSPKPTCQEPDLKPSSE
jgi:hypothetical protein